TTFFLALTSVVAVATLLVGLYLIQGPMDYCEDQPPWYANRSSLQTSVPPHTDTGHPAGALDTAASTPPTDGGHPGLPESDCLSRIGRQASSHRQVRLWNIHNRTGAVRADERHPARL